MATQNLRYLVSSKANLGAHEFIRLDGLHERDCMRMQPVDLVREKERECHGATRKQSVAEKGGREERKRKRKRKRKRREKGEKRDEVQKTKNFP